MKIVSPSSRCRYVWYCPITQRELAKRLGVDESQISRDERNDYHGITVERASRILDILGVEIRSEIHVDISLKKRNNAAKEAVVA